MNKYIIGKRIVLETADGSKIIELELSEEAKAGLTIRGGRIPAYSELKSASPFGRNAPIHQLNADDVELLKRGYQTQHLRTQRRQAILVWLVIIALIAVIAALWVGLYYACLG